MKTSIDQRVSDLLTKDENDSLIRMLGNKCQSLAMAVIQLFLTQGPNHLHWAKKDTGILCFVKDNYRRNYFFRLYCLNRKMQIWEQEMYNNLEYNGSCDYFHSFEADECMAAFNFASEQEAYDMKKVVLDKFQMKRQRREERRSRNLQNNRIPQSKQDMQKQMYPSNTSLNFDSYHNQNIIENQQQSKTKKKRHLTKADIGSPKDFKHVSHVGWDPNKGFDIENIADPQLKQFFNKAGVSDIQLRDKDTRDFIYDFINTHGGLDAVKLEVVENVPKKPPPKIPNENMINPPPVPARTAVNRSAPPPPPGKSRPHRVQPPPRPNNTPRAREPLPQNNAPAPPPPPPMNEIMAPPPPPIGEISAPPPANNSLPPVSDARSALLDSIKAGKALRPVEQAERKTSVGDSRGNLLNEIRLGIELKPVRDVPKTANCATTQNSLAAALSDALKNRALAIQSESESSEEDEEDWD